MYPGHILYCKEGYNLYMGKEKVGEASVFRMGIRINFGRLDPDTDPGGQK
jgi:hypothetical protein